MELVWHIFITLLGIVMILGGANFMTSGAVAVAKRLGISDFVIGLTLVALGSSAPDLAVGLFSAFKGHTQFAIGNVVGSCAFDGLLVVGTVALIRPFRVDKNLLTWQLPCLIIGYIVVMICANDGTIDGSGRNIVTRAEGLLMLILFALMLCQSLRRGDASSLSNIPSAGANSHSAGANSHSAGSNSQSATTYAGAPEEERWSAGKTWLVWIEILGGLAALVWGGNIFVDGASGIAREAHVSETVIGLTVVALGTSLPDLATSGVAAWRGRPGIAVGNVVGSCLFDALVVLGASALACPLPMGNVGMFDLCTMLAGGVLFLVFALISRKRQITRWEGALMCAVYATYVVHVVIKA